ncbi:hypothetical protein EDD17DRAFT_1750441 [Pisolithus thermaeus]|nr:hypothetical protein EDD17DRAFT_1750441 [Pisolithus thermaeus]
MVALSTCSIDLTQDGVLFHHVKHDNYWDMNQYEWDPEMQVHKCLAAYFYASNGKCSPTSTKDLLALKKFSVVKEKFMDSDDMDFCLSPLPEISAPLTSTLQGFCAEDLKMKKKKKLPHTLEEDESCPESTLADLI